LMGIVYITASMNDIYKTISDIKSILLVATSIALMITAVLGFILSKTITDPIQEVTRKAALMARGDFDQKIEVRSNDEIGKLTGMFNFLTTRLKETLDEISDEKEKVEAVLSNMADGVIALNEGGEVIHINPAALKMLSLEEDPLDKNFLQDLHRIFNVNMEETIKSGATEVLVKIRGTVVKSIIAPLQREGRSVGLILVLQDITKQHRLDAMRKEFVANVSHELRTPLATIKSYTETLLDGAMDDKEVATQFLGVVNNEADRMGRLVNDLLELSRLDNRETRWEKRSLDLGRILKDVVSKMEVSATKKRQTLVLDLPEEDGQVFADRDKLEQVFQNILSNATKYTPEGGKVAVRLRRSGNFMEVSFCDNGVGIPKGDLPRIFERFYRVDKTRSRDMGGTGLGLSIAQEIVEAHDGTIGIESETGKGTTVTISLPMLTLARENSEGHEDYDTRSK
jgi:two-component system sensor histidine kinase VicK